MNNVKTIFLYNALTNVEIRRTHNEWLGFKEKSQFLGAERPKPKPFSTLVVASSHTRHAITIDL